MSFLALLTALVLLKVWDLAYRLQVDDWFDYWRKKVVGFGLSEPISLFVTLLAPLVLCAVVLAELRGLLFGLPWLIAAVGLLLYSFGRGDYSSLVAAYQNCVDCDPRQSDAPQRFNTYALDSLGCTEDDLPVAETWIEARLLYLGYERLFAVLFWFWLLGPVAALGYRLLHLLAADSEQDMARQILFWVDWLPIRVLAGLFTLVGDFVAGKSALMDLLDDTHTSAGIVLQQVARASLAVVPAEQDLEGGEALSQARRRKIEQVRSLLNRAVVAWVVVIALWILFV